MIDWYHVEEVAHRLGIEALTVFQQQAIRAVLNGENCLIISSTGSGKSAIFQIPALLDYTGTTIVISPIISLMEDQRRHLMQCDIRGVAALHSRIAGEATQREILRGFAAGHHRLFYIAPERIAHTRQSLIDNLPETPINYLVIDEAHCWIQWQQDFRPEYARIATLIARTRPKAIIALTATAGRFARDQIKHELGLPMSEFVSDTIDRPNLSYVTLPNFGDASVRQWLSEHYRQPGIIFCRSRDHTEYLAKRFSGVCYHGGLDAKTRNHNQRLFMEGQAWLMVATNAFGMGVNKSNIRWTLHLDVPLSLDEFTQETGRAGRDGLPSDCGILLPRTDRLQRYFISTQNPPPWLLKQVYADLEHRRAHEFWRKPTINQSVSLQRIENALSYLKYLGLIESRNISEDTFWIKVLHRPPLSDRGPAAVLAACDLTNPRISLIEQRLQISRKSVLANLNLLTRQGYIRYRRPERSMMYRINKPFEVDERRLIQKLSLMRNGFRVMGEFLKLTTNGMRHQFIRNYFDCEHQLDDTGKCSSCGFILYPAGFEPAREAMLEYQHSANFVMERFV